MNQHSLLLIQFDTYELSRTYLEFPNHKELIKGILYNNTGILKIFQNTKSKSYDNANVYKIKHIYSFIDALHDISLLT